jgi:hypothetical protein
LAKAASADSARRLREPSPLGTISSRSEGMPALARCAAMREPMVPAPSTAARRTSSGRAAKRITGAVAGAMVLMLHSPRARATECSAYALIVPEHTRCASPGQGIVVPSMQRFPQMSSIEPQNLLDLLKTRHRLGSSTDPSKGRTQHRLQSGRPNFLEIRAFFERRAEHHRATGRLRLTSYCHTFAA